MHPSIKRRIADEYQSALRSRKARRFDAAEAGFRRVLALKPDAPEAYFQLGQIERMRGNLRSAIDHYMTALKFKPSEPAIWVPLSETIGQLAEPTIAKDVLRLASKSKLDPVLNGGVRELLLSAKQSTPAIADLNQLIAQKNFDLAIEKGREAIAKDPDDPRLERLAASALNEVGQTDQAIELLESSIRKDPEAAAPRIDLATILQNRGDFESASEHLRSVLKKNNAPGFAAQLYCRNQKIHPDDPLIPNIKRAFRNKNVPPKDRMYLGYRIGEGFGRYRAIRPRFSSI